MEHGCDFLPSPVSLTCEQSDNERIPIDNGAKVSHLTAK